MVKITCDKCEREIGSECEFVEFKILYNEGDKVLTKKVHFCFSCQKILLNNFLDVKTEEHIVIHAITNLTQRPVTR